MHVSVEKLVEAYRRIGDERMRDLPVYHDRLMVEAIGFTSWQGKQVGVLISPWFMNLILLPLVTDSWQGPADGSAYSVRFPSGDLEFQRCAIEGPGVHLSAVLFSSMKGFPDQDTARLVAREVMKNLFDRDTHLASSPRSATKVALDKPVSRRALLRGLVGGSSNQ